MDAQVSSGEVTDLLRAVHEGDPKAVDRLMEVVYQELRRMAAAIMRKERRGHSMPPTALVHEVYLRLIRGNIPAESRRHFYAIAARSMRQVLVDYARRKMAARRAARPELRVELRDDMAVSLAVPDEVLAVHEAPEKLAALDPRQVQIM